MTKHRRLSSPFQPPDNSLGGFVFFIMTRMGLLELLVGSKEMLGSQ